MIQCNMNPFLAKGGPICFIIDEWLWVAPGEWGQHYLGGGHIKKH